MVDARMVDLTESSHGVPTVSIGMPVYNAEKYIRGALDSLLSQTFTGFELIISDNASTDETGEICQEYAQKDWRIHYIRQAENIGPMANFQFVLSQAKGKYFMWAAHDDRRAPAFLERAVALLEGDEGCGLVFSNYIERDLESGKESLHRVAPSNHRSAMYNFITRTINMCPSLIYGLFRRDHIKNAEFTTPFDFSDVHFIAGVALKARIRVIADYLYIAGTRGARAPYSLTHAKINRTVFLRRQYDLLKEYFHFPVTQCLFFLVCLVMFYNKLRLWRY